MGSYGKSFRGLISRICEKFSGAGVAENYGTQENKNKKEVESIFPLS